MHTIRPVLSALILGSTVLLFSCASLQGDILASTANEEVSGEFAAVAAAVVPLDTATDTQKIREARTLVRDLERKDVKDTVFEARLLAWSGRLYLLEGKRPEAARALSRAQSLAGGETAVAVLESRLEPDPDKRLDFLNRFREFADTPAVLEIERARTLEELRRYHEAVAAFDTAFPALPAYYRKTYEESRNRAWELRALAPDHATGSGTLAMKPEITLEDALVLLRDETVLLDNNTGGSYWTAERLYRDLNTRGLIPVDSVGTIRLQDTLTRAYAAWLLWQLTAEYRAQPALKTRYSDRIRTLPNPRSPIADVPHGSRWFDSVMGCVEWEIMNLPDGKNFFPNQPVSGISFIEMLRRVK